MKAIIDQLEATPEILRGLMAALSEDDASWKPAPDRFSIAEVLEHLSHTEGHCFRRRVDEVMAQDRAKWQAYDPQVYAAAGQYSGRNAEDSFAHFEEQREDNVALLRSLPADAGERVGMHPKLGPITLAQQLNEWAFHDLGHIRQIAELVRARKYHPNMGPYQQMYKVQP